MKVLFVIVLSFSSSFIFSQIRGTIQDGSTGKGVPFATVYSKNDPKKGCYAGEDGSFFLDIPLRAGDSVCIEAVGYKKLTASIRDSLALNLLRHTADLPEVVIKDVDIEAQHKMALGLHKEKKEMLFTGTIGGKIIVQIPSPDTAKDYMITKLFFQIAKPLSFNMGNEAARKKFSEGRVRILLYDADSINCRTYNLLIPENVICEVDKKNHLLKVDILKYKVWLPPHGVFVGLEWLGEKGNNETSNLAPWYFGSKSSNFIKMQSFYGEGFRDDFSKISGESQTANKYVPNFGIEVVEKR